MTKTSDVMPQNRSAVCVGKPLISSDGNAIDSGDREKPASSYLAQPFESRSFRLRTQLEAVMRRKWRDDDDDDPPPSPVMSAGPRAGPLLGGAVADQALA